MWTEYTAEWALDSIACKYIVVDTGGHMKSKGHFYISLVKSAIRTAGCAALLTGHLLAFGWAFLVAEVLGVVEEIADER